MGFDVGLRRAALGICLLTLVFLPWPTPSPMLPRKRPRGPLIGKGRTQRKQNDLAGALESFRAADAIMHVPTTGLELARTQVALGQLVDALVTSATEPVPGAGGRSTNVAAGSRGPAAELDKDLKMRIPRCGSSLLDVPQGLTLSVLADGTVVPAPALAAGYRLNPGQIRLSPRQSHGKPNNR